MILVSACLLGINCKYSGGNNKNIKLMELLKDEILIPICPEQLGGLTTPRPPAEIKKGSGEDVLLGRASVLNINGEDVTGGFIRGAEETLKICKIYGINTAILKAKSPSCGCGRIYSGNFDNCLKDGNGVAAQFLINNGIKVYNDEEALSLCEK